MATDDVEITPEMIDAGVRVILDYDREDDDPVLAVRWIFQAMTAAQNRKRREKG